MGGKQFSRAMSLVARERDRQDSLWGDQEFATLPQKWLTVLTEEVGEAARAILEYKHEELLTEAIQVTAVAVAFIESALEAMDPLDVQDD